MCSKTWCKQWSTQTYWQQLLLSLSLLLWCKQKKKNTTTLSYPLSNACFKGPSSPSPSLMPTWCLMLCEWSVPGLQRLHMCLLSRDADSHSHPVIDILLRLMKDTSQWHRANKPIDSSSRMSYLTPLIFPTRANSPLSALLSSVWTLNISSFLKILSFRKYKLNYQLWLVVLCQNHRAQFVEHCCGVTDQWCGESVMSVNGKLSDVVSPWLYSYNHAMSDLKWGHMGYLRHFVAFLRGIGTRNLLANQCILWVFKSPLRLSAKSNLSHWFT